MKGYFLKKQIFFVVFSLITFNLFPQTFVEQTGISLSGVYFSSVSWIDYDNDGYLDIILTGLSTSGNSPKIYRNNRNNTFTEQTSISFTGVDIGASAWGDYNNDEYLDILMTGNNEAGEGISKIYHYNGNNTFGEQTGISFTGVSAGSVASGDYDNDGDLDILLTGIDCNTWDLVSKIYRNEGNFIFTEQTNISLTGVIESCVAWGDYDNDGFLDILLTGRSDLGAISKIYHNNQNNTFTEQTNIFLTGVYESSVAWGDYDNDGFLDILLIGQSNFGPVSKIYHNNHNNTFTEQTNISLIGIYYGSANWGDYDNDGNLDILLIGSTSSGPISKIYRNNGNNTFTEQTGISLPGVDYSSSAWGDYDNDGDLDILLTGQDKNGNIISKIYRNNCPIINKNPDQPKNLSYEIQSKNILLKWNKVTTDETWSKSITYNLRVGRKSGSSDFVSAHSASNGFRRIVAMGNAQLDTTFIFKTRWDTVYFASVQAVDNSFKGGAFSNEIQFKISPAQPSDLYATYISSTSLMLRWKRGNGDRCIIFAKEGTTGTANPQNFTTYYANPIFAEGPPLGTTNWYCIYKGEADSILLSGLNPQKSYVIHAIEFQGKNCSEIYAPTLTSENIGTFSTSLFSEQTGISIIGVRASSVAWGDYDNDGYLDILLTGLDPSFDEISKVYRNNGDNTFTEQTGIILAGVHYGSVAWGDYNNDGNLDILLTGASSSGPISKIYRNNGDNTFTEQSSISLTGVSRSSVTWGDYDNDGYLDILLTGIVGYNPQYTPISKIYHNNGNNTFSEQTNIFLTDVGSSSVAWGDYDNDGFLDILLTGYNNTDQPISKIYHNNQNNTFTEQTNISLTGSLDGSVGWGDYDNDGFLDILLSGFDSSDNDFCKIYHNNGDQSFTEQRSVSLPGIYRGSAIWGDYDNDGFLDILLAGIASVNNSKIFHNNGDNTFTELIGISLKGVFEGSVAWGDYDNDGDLDILLVGLYGTNDISNIYRNNIVMNAGTIKPNTKPYPPTGLIHSITPGNIKLSWLPITTDETPSKTMGYNLRYKLKGEARWRCAPHAADNGYRRLEAMGNIQLNKSMTLKNLSSGTYYFQVQAVDQGYKGSSWSAVDSFVVRNVQTFFSVDTVCQGLPTHFTDQSIAADGIASWKWDFKDGITSILQNPSHLFSTGSTYNVKLVITSIGGVKDSLEKNTTVKLKPANGFTAPATCQGTATTITNTTNNNGLTISSWYWNFGDGQTSTVQQPPAHGYLGSGNYTVLLKALASNGCIDSTSKIVTVASYPVAAINASSSLTFCKGDSVALSVAKNTNYSYKWLLNGTNLTNGDSSKYIAKLSGNYTVAVTNKTGNCKTTSDQAVVTAQNAPAGPLISAGVPVQFCQGDSVILSVTNTSGYAYQWKQNGGSVGTNQNTLVAKSAGSYSVTVTNSSGCSANSSNTVNVVVNPKPTVPTVSISGATSFCLGNSVDLSVINNSAYSYQWQNNGSNISGATSNAYTATSSGVYSLNITNSSGCISKTENVTVNTLTVPNAPLISAGTATQFCQGDSVVLSVTNTSGYNYQWKLNGGAVGSNANKYTAKSAGTYTMVVSNSSGCSASSTNSINVVVNSLPVLSNISSSGLTFFCQGGNVVLSVTNNASYTYQWFNSPTTISGATTNSYTAATSGSYLLQISNTSGCSVKTTAVSIVVKAMPYKPVIKSDNYQTGQCLGENPIKLKVDQVVTDYNYQWSRNGTPISNATLSYLEGFLAQGDYTLEADLSGCKAQSDVFSVTFQDALAKPTVYAEGPNVWYLACTNDSASQYKWYYNGTIIQGADKFIYVANRNLGQYSVSIANSKGCFTMSDAITIPTGATGIKDIDPFAGLKIYPNPTPGLFTIEMDNQIFGGLLINIIAQEGKEILKIKFEKTTVHFSSQIDLSGQPKGMYLINLLIDKYLANRKVIVE